LERTAAGNTRYVRASGFADEDAALLHGWTQMAKAQAGRPDPRKAATPLGEWAATWMAAQNHSAVTATQRRRLLRTLILPTFGKTPIGEINKFVVRQWAGKLTCAEVTRGHAVSLLSTILTGAEEAQMIEVNPLVRMRLRKAGAQRIQRVEETEAIWAYPETALQIATRLPRPANLM